MAEQGSYLSILRTMADSIFARKPANATINAQPAIAGPPIVYRPTELAINEWKERMNRMGVVDCKLDLIPSEVVDHMQRPSVVYAPTVIKRSQKQSSKEAIEWLKYMEQTVVHLPIWHEENGHEVALLAGNTVHHVDGYCPYNLTVYEYLGEQCHPFPLTTDMSIECGSVEKRCTAGMIHDQEFCKYYTLGLLGFRVVSAWASQWALLKRSLLRKGGRKRGKVVPPSPQQEVVALTQTATAAAAMPASEGAPVVITQWANLASLLYVVKNNLKAGTDLSARRMALVANAAPNASTLLEGEGFFRFYELRPITIDPKDREYFSSDRTLLQYISLQATTRGTSIRESLKAVMESASPNEILPFSFSSGKERITRSDLAKCIAIVTELVSIIYPTVWNQRCWEFPAVPREAIEVNMRASVYGLAQREEDLLIRLFGKTRAQFPSAEKWSFAKTLSFINPLFSKVLNMEFKKTSQPQQRIMYSLDRPTMFIWTGVFYVPILGSGKTN